MAIELTNYKVSDYRKFLDAREKYIALPGGKSPNLRSILKPLFASMSTLTEKFKLGEYRFFHDDIFYLMAREVTRNGGDYSDLETRFAQKYMDAFNEIITEQDVRDTEVIKERLLTLANAHRDFSSEIAKGVR